VDVANFESEDDKDEAVFLVQKASQAIAAWKAHQLRSINQDRAQLEVLEFLDPSCVLIVQDFAMKFIPVQYREAQSDFFGKIGKSVVSMNPRRLDTLFNLVFKIPLRSS